MQITEEIFNNKIKQKNWGEGKYFIPKFFDKNDMCLGLDHEGLWQLHCADYPYWLPYEEPPKRVEWGMPVVKKLENDGVEMGGIPTTLEESKHIWKDKFLGFAKFSPETGMFYWEGE